MTTQTTSKYDGVTISDRLQADSLFGGADTDGIDVKASYDRYVEMVTEEVEAALPGIEVEFEVDFRCVGYCRPASVFYVGEFRSDEDDIRRIYNDASTRVFEDGGWIVEQA